MKKTKLLLAILLGLSLNSFSQCSVTWRDSTSHKIAFRDTIGAYIYKCGGTIDALITKYSLYDEIWRIPSIKYDVVGEDTVQYKVLKTDTNWSEHFDTLLKRNNIWIKVTGEKADVRYNTFFYNGKLVVLNQH